MSPSLSVTVMRGPMPKRRRNWIPEEEYLASLSTTRRHCCDYVCSHKDLSTKEKRQNTYKNASITKQKIQPSSIKLRDQSVKCSVGDLDKSHIASILNTPTRSVTSIPDGVNTSRAASTPDPIPQASKINQYSYHTCNNNSGNVINDPRSAVTPAPNPVSSNTADPVQVVCALHDTEDDNTTDSDSNTSSSDDERQVNEQGST